MNTQTLNIEKIEISTGLLPVINVGMYESALDPNHMFDLYELSEKAANQYWELYSNDMYTDKIRDLADKFIDRNITPVLKALNCGIESVETLGITSPRFYNYESDKLNIDLFIDLEVFRAIINYVDKSELDEFLSKAFRSYNGFCSFMPQSYNELIEKLESDTERAVSAFITFLLNKNEFDFEETQRDFETYVSENVYYTMFINENVDKRTYKKLFTELKNL